MDKRDKELMYYTEIEKDIFNIIIKIKNDNKKYLYLYQEYLFKDYINNKLYTSLGKYKDILLNKDILSEFVDMSTIQTYINKYNKIINKINNIINLNILLEKTVESIYKNDMIYIALKYLNNNIQNKKLKTDNILEEYTIYYNVEIDLDYIINFIDNNKILENIKKLFGVEDNYDYDNKLHEYFINELDESFNKKNKQIEMEIIANDNLIYKKMKFESVI